MVIYLVTNRISGKKYVGQSVRTPEYRWASHVSDAKRLKKTTALGKAIRKYGRDSFDIEVIDTANSIEELNTKEWFFANMLNTYVPNGYNIAVCGSGYVKTKKAIHNMSKDWIFLSPTNEIIRFHNMNAFCRENGLSPCKMSSVASNKRFSCDGWRNARRPNRTYHITNINTGECRDIIHVQGITKKVALEIGIKPSGLSSLLRGKIKERDGWVLQSVSMSEIPREFLSQTLEVKPLFKRKHSEITARKMAGTVVKRLLNNSEMKIYEFTNISRFVKSMRLQHALVINVLSGKTRAKHKRWSLPSNPIKRFVVEKEGIEFEIFDGEIKAFCRMHGIRSPEYFFQLLNEKRSEYRDWVLKKSYTPDATDLPVEVLKQYDIE